MAGQPRITIRHFVFCAQTPDSTDVTASAIYKCHYGRGGRGAPGERSARPTPATRMLESAPPVLPSGLRRAQHTHILPAYYF